ncbi:hypothetical protein OAL13_00610 [bacterium]|nr:hypothetical protein [bacterium]
MRSRRLGVEPNCLSRLDKGMNEPSEFLSPETIQKLEKSALLVTPLLDAQLSFEIDDLTPHQNEYWNWWVLEEQTSISRKYEEDEKSDPIHEIAEGFSHACKRELEIIRTISDSALELRRTRLASERKRTAA